MVTYGDGVTDLDIRMLLKFHKKQKTIGTITGVHPRSRFGMLEAADKNNMVKNFSEKPVLKDWVNGGFMVFDKRVFNYLKAGETEHPALQKLAREKQLSLYKHEGFFLAMDTYREVEELNKLWNSGNPSWKVWK